MVAIPRGLISKGGLLTSQGKNVIELFLCIKFISK